MQAQAVSALCPAAGELLLYFYGREYWSTARASMALAQMSDDKEAKLMRRSAELTAHNQQLMASHLALQVQLRDLKTVHVNLVKQTEGVCLLGCLSCLVYAHLGKLV